MASMIETIKRRKSVRTFRDQALGVVQKSNIQRVCYANILGPLGNRSRFAIVDISEQDKQAVKKLGTYGMINGCNCFIAGIVKPAAANALIDFGYSFEKTVLELTAIGLGTCWMAGTFNKAGFVNQAQLKEGESLVVLSPVGLAAQKKSIVESLIDWIKPHSKRKSWDMLFFEGATATPLTREKAGRYATALECVRVAPSAINVQPWRIIKDPAANVFHFCSIPQKKAGNEELHIGIAMANFELAARESALTGKWKIVNTTIDGMRCYVDWVGQQ